MKKINIALVGFGMSGRQFHLPAFINHPMYDVKVVLTRNPKNQNDFKALCPNSIIVENFNDILNNEEIDLVVNTASNDVHYEYTKAALLKGKHVVCEKPFVETHKEALKLYEIAEKNNLILRVFHNRAYDGDIMTLKQLMEKRDFGKLLNFSARWDRFVPEIGTNWRFKDTVMSGLFYDLAPHLVHHTVSLFGEPLSVHLDLFKERVDSVTDDHFELTMYYKDLVCYIGADMFQREAKPRLALVGTNATYAKYGLDLPDSVNVKVDDLYQTTNLRSVFINNKKEEENIPLLKGQHYRFYDLLANHINNGIKNDEDKQKALRVIKVLEKGIESFNKKQIIDL